MIPPASSRSRARRVAAAVIVVSSLLLLASVAIAHPLAPALLELHESKDGALGVVWKEPLIGSTGGLEPELPAWCRRRAAPEIEPVASAWRVTWTSDCGDRGLSGGRLGVRGLALAGTTALVRLARDDGTTRQWLLTPSSEFVEIAAAEEGAAAVSRRFVLLGAEHLVAGPDHLAFVAGLFLLVRQRRALLAAVTAFTLGHSATLSLAVLGTAPLAPPLVEIGIAASIVLVAVELARGRGGASAFARRPWLVAIAFGLLHGAGFASALRQVGVPPDEMALALLSFNAGIEVGQIAILLALAALRSLVGRLPAVAPPWLERLPAEALGALGAFWLVERAAALL